MDPRSATAWYWLGRSYVIAGTGMSYSRAIEAFGRALALDATVAEAHWGLGLAHYGLTEYEAAARELSAFLATAPDRVAPEMRGEAEHFLGVLARQAGDLDGSLAHLERAAALHPRFADTPYERGLTLEAAGRHDEAVAAFVAATKLEPNHLPSHFRLSRLYRQLGREPEAIREERLHRALNDLFDNKTGRNREDPARRLELWGEIAGLAPENHKARLEFAKALAELGRDAEALLSLDDLVKSAPEFVDGYLLAADLALRGGDRKAAVARLVALRKALPDLPVTVIPPKLQALLEKQ